MFIQLEHNVPDIYIEKSRDFQLLCRIIDIVINAAAERSSGMIDNLDVDTIEENLLYLLVRKMGFTSHKYFPPKVLKNIAEIFPYCIRNKGTVDAIKKAVYAVVSAERDVRYLDVQYNSQDVSIQIATSASNIYIDYIAALLEFIMPAGVRWNYFPGVTIYAEHTDDVKVNAGVVRFRGFGAVVSRIIREVATIIPEYKKGLNSWGVDWDELKDKYTKAWNTEREKGDKVNGFYSKVNVAKIIKNNPEGNNTIIIDNKN